VIASLPEPPVASSTSEAIVSCSPAAPRAWGLSVTVTGSVVGVVDRILTAPPLMVSSPGPPVMVSRLPPASTSFAWLPTIVSVVELMLSSSPA
jgi:hypothetical protein